MIKSKIETYLGFCLRARKLLLGVDNVESAKKDVYLLLADEKLGESSLKQMIKAKEHFACPLLMAQEGFLAECLHRAGVKALAVRDKSLAGAILQATQTENQVKLYSGGNN